MNICIASDHAGFILKEKIIKYIDSTNIKDLGCYSLDRVDYPYYGKLVGEKITQNIYTVGILVCGTGIGISIAANRYSSVRAALCYDVTTARLCRKHNDANVLALGARQTTPELAEEIVDVFLNTAFEGGRHKIRVDQL